MINVLLPFEYLSAVNRNRAVARFIDAGVNDGYLYELDIDGSLLSRIKQGNSKGEMNETE